MAEEMAQAQPRLTAPRSVRCIVKLGGAAITNKGELESINEENLRSACAQLRHAMSESDGDGAMEKVLGMDWSRKPGDPVDPAVDAEWIAGIARLGLDTNFVVVHGAGSFGHFQASRSGVHKGGLHSTLVKAGFVATRISVTSLNQEIVRALAREGIPSVGMSPFACGWSTQQRKLASANASQIFQSLHAGFVPVSCCSKGFEPLFLQNFIFIKNRAWCSGSLSTCCLEILEKLSKGLYHIEWGCHYTTSCTASESEICSISGTTDVHGVYDRPPTDSNAVLLREIEVDDIGGWSIVKPALLQGNTKGVEISVAAHDTTGGMETKILEAAVIARLGIDVYITKAGTEHSLRALKGDVSTDSEDWLGTIIRSSK
ncbi:Pentatricopeptide (PPR) repeat protein-like [Zea mays]|uniref:Pentatricopeptide (PPR) repeat protein-like n=1 Tax=Zea mays TaxID=4577 RepID=A0A1D6GAV2_MAIZE|nr:Pentatricopeptide (PPR) repeat protein-like [Zea mays]AQL00224.1 Pentatricopeptide (PPR) repeat protein-like [Zea mays]